MLATAINGRALAAGRAQIVIEQAAKHPDTEIRDLFERFLPPDRRVPRLGDSIKPAELLAITGDPVRGKQIYLEASGVACKSCHQVEGQGGQIGPPLDAIGKKYAKAEILENILTPSRKIDAKYQTYLVATSTGVIATGLLVEQSDDVVVLRDATGKDKRYRRAQVELLEPQQKSLMPEMLLRDFTAQQAADLLAYLASLKADES